MPCILYGHGHADTHTANLYRRFEQLSASGPGQDYAAALLDEGVRQPSTTDVSDSAMESTFATDRE
jgi:hypothetical protein